MGRLSVRVKPKSSRSQILGCQDGVWQVALNAPPQEGQANRELLKLLAKALKLPPSSLTIASGDKSRQKSVAIPDLSDKEIEQRLAVHSTNSK